MFLEVFPRGCAAKVPLNGPYCGRRSINACIAYTGAWLVKWILSVPSVRKVVGSTPPLAAT